MMNHMPAGPGQPPHISPALPMHPQQRRQQEYHAYHLGPPQSPMHPHAYANFHPPYYGHPVQPPYPPHRWQHQLPYPPQPFMPMQQVPQPYQPRSPMVVTSQPHASNMPPVHRHHSLSQVPHIVPSPRSVPQHVQHQPHVVAPPSPILTPKEEKIPSTPPPAPPPRAHSPASSAGLAATDHRMPFYPSLPWYSPGANSIDFPTRVILRRKKLQKMHNLSDSVALPLRDVEDDTSANAHDEPPSEASTLAAPSELETPATSQAPSESDFAAVSTPSAPAQAVTTPKSPTSQQQHARKDTRSAIAIPNIPAIAKVKANGQASDKPDAPQQPAQDAPASSSQVVDVPASSETSAAEGSEQKPETKAAPKSWADLVRTRTIAAASTNQTDSGLRPSKPALSKSASLAEALKQYDVEQNPILSFLEPRGLVNTGNMCYMNSVLQVLVFCSPFYSFLDQVRQRTVHSLNSETPLLDAIIMFMREFKPLATAESAAALSSQLKPEQLEQYGEPVTPEYVYDAIRKLPRFQTMRRGHQQDAEEFLGFLLEGLHDECVNVITDQPHSSSMNEDAKSSGDSAGGQSGEGWLEVGPKQKASITRTAGAKETPSPIDKIFGGHLRSELRVAGLKDSVTLEPYKPLQLDIGAPNVHNIVDALKGLTRAEALTGDFGGKNNTAKKQVFIDTLPPVLILHLKRFQYDNNLSGTQKIWKKVGYPLELEIPREVFTPAKRGGFAVKGGLPKYRLISVVYHHGKSAAGGHYTVDVLRQDDREWVRMDDTMIRRIRSEDVAEGGAEEDPKVLVKALEQHKADQDLQKQRNMYEGLDSAEQEPEDERPWSEVNGHFGGSNKKWTSIVNTDGTATPTSTTGKRTPTARREGVKDNKVAYILLYQRVRH